jgi:hypothetical protein
MAGAEALAGLAGAALFAVAGAGLVQLLPGVRALPRGPRLAYAYLLGIAWTGGSLYALSHLFSVPLRRPAVLAVLAVPVLAGLLARWRLPTRPAPPARPRNALRTIVFVLAALISLGVLCEALVSPLRDWDGRMTWVPQARYVHAEGTVDARILREADWYVTHPRYPLLLPLAQVALAALFPLGEDAHAVYRPLYAFFFPTLLLLVDGGARRWVGGSAAALAALSAALLPFITFYPVGGAVSAYSDLPLACFYGGALLLLLRARPRLSHGIAAGLLLAGAVLAKNEGTPLALWALLVAGLSVARSRGRLAPVLAAAVPAALALALLVSWRSAIPNRYDEGYGDLLTLANLWPEIVTRLPLLLAKIRLQMANPHHWTVFWSVAPVVLLAGWRGLKRRAAGPLALAALAPLGIAWLAYTVSPDPAELVRTTWNRFLLQALLPVLVLLAFALDDLLRRTGRLPRALGGPARSPSPNPGRSAGTGPDASPSSAAPDPPRKTG